MAGKSIKPTIISNMDQLSIQLIDSMLPGCAGWLSYFSILVELLLYFFSYLSVRLESPLREAFERSLSEYIVWDGCCHWPEDCWTPDELCLQAYYFTSPGP